MVGALSDDARLTSVCLSRTSGLCREQRPGKAKTGTEVAHVTLDSDTTFKVKTCMVRGILWRPPAQLVNTYSRGTCPLIHPNYFSVIIFVSVTELTPTLTLNRPKNNSGELTDKHHSRTGICYMYKLQHGLQ